MNEQQLSELVNATENSIANEICGELLANYSDERLGRLFMIRGYILKPIENWLDLYEEGET